MEICDLKVIAKKTSGLVLWTRCIYGQMGRQTAATALPHPMNVGVGKTADWSTAAIATAAVADNYGRSSTVTSTRR